MVNDDPWTPGPWHQDAHYVVGEVPNGRPGGEVIISCTPTVTHLTGYPWEQRRANARLVAATPEMVDLLEETFNEPTWTTDDRLEWVNKRNRLLAHIRGKA